MILNQEYFNDFENEPETLKNLGIETYTLYSMIFSAVMSIRTRGNIAKNITKYFEGQPDTPGKEQQ